jgi:hypothetical protein
MIKSELKIRVKKIGKETPEIKANVCLHFMGFLLAINKTLALLGEKFISDMSYHLILFQLSINCLLSLLYKWVSFHLLELMFHNLAKQFRQTISFSDIAKMHGITLDLVVEVLAEKVE